MKDERGDKQSANIGRCNPQRQTRWSRLTWDRNRNRSAELCDQHERTGWRGMNKEINTEKTNKNENREA